MNRSRADDGELTREVSWQVGLPHHTARRSTTRHSLHRHFGPCHRAPPAAPCRGLASPRRRGWTGPRRWSSAHSPPTGVSRLHRKVHPAVQSRLGGKPDIGRHFLVSAPSVNQMIQALERRGFITRQRGVPRSIRLVYHANQSVQQLQQAATGGLRSNFSVQRASRRLAER